MLGNAVKANRAHKSTLTALQKLLKRFNKLKYDYDRIQARITSLSTEKRELGRELLLQQDTSNKLMKKINKDTDGIIAEMRSLAESANLEKINWQCP